MGTLNAGGNGVLCYMLWLRKAFLGYEQVTLEPRLRKGRERTALADTHGKEVRGEVGAVALTWIVQGPRGMCRALIFLWDRGET